jgi:hypothetical protein
MQAKQILMYESRKDFYDWLLGSDLAMSEEEVKSNEKKTSVIIPPMQNITTYLEYANYFQCDSIQTMAWATSVEGEEKPRVSLIPIHVASMQYVPNETPEKQCAKCDDDCSCDTE